MRGDAAVQDKELKQAFLEGAKATDDFYWCVTVHLKGKRVFLGAGYTGPQEALDAAMKRMHVGRGGYDVHIKQWFGDPDVLGEIFAGEPRYDGVEVEVVQVDRRDTEPGRVDPSTGVADVD